MKTVIILSCVLGIALCVPVGTKDPPPTVAFPVQADSTDQAEAIRKRRHLFGINIDVYNNNGFGYFGKYIDMVILNLNKIKSRM